MAMATNADQRSDDFKCILRGTHFVISVSFNLVPRLLHHPMKEPGNEEQLVETVQITFVTPIAPMFSL